MVQILWESNYDVKLICDFVSRWVFYTGIIISCHQIVQDINFSCIQIKANEVIYANDAEQSKTLSSIFCAHIYIHVFVYYYWYVYCSHWGHIWCVSVLVVVITCVYFKAEIQNTFFFKENPSVLVAYHSLYCWIGKQLLQLLKLVELYEWRSWELC